MAPRLVVLQVGMNDFMNERRSPKEAAAEYRRILQALAQRLPSAQVVCVSLYPGYDTLLYKPQRWQADMEALNREIRALAQQHGCGYVDLYTALQDPATGLGSRVYLKDGVHPSAEGYRVMTGLVAEYM